MPFQPGNKLGGRTKGAKDVKTVQWHNIGEYLLMHGSTRYLEELKKAKGQEYMERFERILEYFKPKLARRENSLDVNGSVKMFPKLTSQQIQDEESKHELLK